MKKCTRCGFETMDENAKFCPSCGAKMKTKTNKGLFVGCGIFVVIVAILIFGGGNGIESKVKKLLENDLDTSVKISALYYNEEEQACLVGFETKMSTDVAAVYLDNDKILYDSDFDYYSAKAERLRTESPINESELHECNQKVLEYGELAMWKFTIVANGATKENGWEKIK